MRRSRKPKAIFPDLASGDAAIVCVEFEIIPLLCGLVRKFEQRDVWETVEDWQKGYQWAVAFQECLMGCAQDIINEQRRLYRLLDTALNGTIYTATPIPDSDDYDVTPPLPPAPTAAAAAPGLRARFERHLALLDNLATGRTYSSDPNNPAEPALVENIGIRERIRKIQGTINAGWFGIGGQDATLADVIASLRVGDDSTKDSLWDKFQEILGAGSSLTSIASFIEGLFKDTAQLTTEGGILATLIGSTLANAAMMGAQAAQLDRLIASLDGGGAVRPGDNVLQALRGDVEANDVRNVIDAATNVVVRDKLDRLVDEVSKINSSNADLADLLAKLEDIRELLV